MIFTPSSRNRNLEEMKQWCHGMCTNVIMGQEMRNHQSLPNWLSFSSVRHQLLRANCPSSIGAQFRTGPQCRGTRGFSLSPSTQPHYFPDPNRPGNCICSVGGTAHALIFCMPPSSFTGRGRSYFSPSFSSVQLTLNALCRSCDPQINIFKIRKYFWGTGKLDWIWASRSPDTKLRPHDIDITLTWL